jgi:outer membrane protein
MKNLSITLNIILLVAVGILYYLHFSGGKQKSKTPLIKTTILNDSSAGHSLIAYIELDSMYNQISYISTKRKELEAEQRGIETEWQNGYRGLENKKNEFLKKGAAITDAMAQEFQGDLMQQKDRIDSRKEQLTEKLSEKQYRFMDDIQKKLKDFLASYNEQRQFSYIFTTGTGLEYMAYKDSALNITADVINGMNEKLHSLSDSK